jgi:hypothetical protein
VVEFDKNNIKDLKEDDGNVYKIFAMEGLEKGCEIEYFYTSKRPVSYFGGEVVQNGSPELHTLVQIICPDRLRFDMKAYNSTSAASDTVIGHKRFTRCIINDIPAAEEEKYDAYQVNLARVEFKLSYNDVVRKGERLFTWNDLAKRVYAIYTYTNEKENKRVADLVKDNGWDNLTSEPEKIMAVENYVKKRFTYNEDIKSEEANLLGTVLQNKNAGIIGLMRLYGTIFKDLGINFQYVLTANRAKYVIDKTFENWNNCDYPIFYFPSENTFMAPTRPDYRYPWIFPSWGDANGLFCKVTSLGTITTALAEIKPVPLEKYSSTFDDIDSKIELTPGLDSANVDARQTFSGYMAVDYRDAFNFSNEEQRRLIIKELGKLVSGSEHLLFSEIIDPEFEKGNTNTPLTVHTKSRSGELIEQAGNKLLLKIGLAIGPQVEMYQEKARRQPVYIDFGHVEERKINFVIPDGYAISNLDDLKINQTFSENGGLTMGFVSSYELKGNLLSIHIMEEYRNTSYPLVQFDQFRKIINASSDFNKVVLVLEKKS